MNPFADVTYLTAPAWSELDARMEEFSRASRSSVEKLGNWHSSELEDYYRQSIHEGCPRPLGERIGILRRAWIDLSKAPAIDSCGTVELKFRPGLTEAIEHWIQMSHDGSRYRISTEAYARRIEGHVRVCRTFPECRAGEGGTLLDEARALARPMYCPPLDAAQHLWSVNPFDDRGVASLRRHPVARLTAQHVYVKWREADEHAFPVNRDELERLGYAEPKMDAREAFSRRWRARPSGRPRGSTLYAAQEFAEALLDLEALAAWRRQGLEEDLQERGRSSFSVLGYYLAKKETPRQKAERLRRADEYINGPRIFSVGQKNAASAWRSPSTTTPRAFSPSPPGYQTIRPCMAQLRAEGLVYDTGLRRAWTGAVGSPAATRLSIAWRLTALGDREYAAQCRLTV